MPTGAQHSAIGDEPLWIETRMPDAEIIVARTRITNAPKSLHRSLRQVEGRRLAKLAQARLGLPPQDIASGPDGAPIWPDGQRGSFSHWHDLSLCLLTRNTARDYGADIEGFAEESSISAICCEAVTVSERAFLGNTHPVNIDAALVFSAKKSFFKAAYPSVGNLAPGITRARHVSVRYQILDPAAVTWTAL